MVTPQALRKVPAFIGVGTNESGERVARFLAPAYMQVTSATPVEVAPLTIGEIDNQITAQAMGAGLSGDRGEAHLQQLNLALQHLRR